MHSVLRSAAVLVSLVNSFLPLLLMIHLSWRCFPWSLKRLIIKIPALISLRHFKYASNCVPMQTEKFLSLHSSPLRRTALHFRIKKPINPSPSWAMHKWISYMKMSKKNNYSLSTVSHFAFHFTLSFCIMCACVKKCMCVCVWTSMLLCGIPRFNGKPCLVSPTSLFDRPDEK